MATSAATGAVGAAVPALVGGPAAAAAAAGAGAAAGAAAAAPTLAAPVINLASSTLNAAMNIVPPRSAEKKVSSVFDLLINEVKANADLPALLLDSRLWNQTATHGGYRAQRVAIDGSTPAEVTADWIIAAGRDYAAARVATEKAKTPPPKERDATTPAARYHRDQDGAVTTPVRDRPDLGATAKIDTPDVRLLTAPAPGAAAGATPPANTVPVVWLPDGPASVADRLIAAAGGQGAAAALLRGGSPVLVALAASQKGTV
jgi:hypothetical protein